LSSLRHNERIMIKITDKQRRIAIIISAIIIFAVLSGSFLFRPNKAEVLVPGNVAMKVDGMKISVGFYNYFYSSSTTPEILIELEKEYEGFDQHLPLDEQIYDASTGKTWKEYIDETVKDQISHLVKAYNKGVAANICVFDEQQENIETIIKALETEAEKLSIGINDYTSYTYGNYVGEKTVRKILEMSYIAQNYYEYYIVQKELSSDIYDDFYERNKDYLISVEYFCCEIPAKNNINEKKDEALLLLPELSAENFEETLAKKFPDFQTVISERQGTKLTFEGNDNVRKWLFDESRKAGDKIVIADEEKDRVYVLLAKTGLVEETEKTCSAREIAMRVSEFGDWETLDKIANNIQNKINDAENKEYVFAVYADIYMNNIQPTDASGGLLTNIRNGNGEAESWLFDSERKRKDFICLKNENGYYLIMFVEKKPAWQYLADEEIKETEFKNSIKDNIDIQKKYAFRFTEGYIDGQD